MQDLDGESMQLKFWAQYVQPVPYAPHFWTCRLWLATIFFKKKNREKEREQDYDAKWIILYTNSRSIEAEYLPQSIVLSDVCTLFFKVCRWTPINNVEFKYYEENDAYIYWLNDQHVEKKIMHISYCMRYLLRIGIEVVWCIWEFKAKNNYFILNEKLLLINKNHVDFFLILEIL